jgi:lysine-specific permease
LAFQGGQAESLPFAAPFFPFGPWFIIISLSVLMIGMMVGPLAGKTSLLQLCSSFGGLLIYLLFYMGYKLYHRNSFLGSMVRIEECDLLTGRVL